MTKVRKQRKAKRFNYGANRKKMNNKTKIPRVKDKTLRQAWQDDKTTVQNLADMGLAYDPNTAVPIPEAKMSSSRCIKMSEDKTYVRKAVEEEATGPMKKIFRLPKAQVNSLSKLLDKYGGNYSEMAKDEMNIFQYTPKELKRRIKQFRSIPEQWDAYIESRQQQDDADATVLKETMESEANKLSEHRKNRKLAKKGGRGIPRNTLFRVRSPSKEVFP